MCTLPGWSDVIGQSRTAILEERYRPELHLRPGNRAQRISSRWVGVVQAERPVAPPGYHARKALKSGLLALSEQVQNQLDASRYAQLVVDAEKAIAHGVLTAAELDANFSIREPIGE